jgi:hypothetical protein
MTRLDMVRMAIAELGDTTTADQIVQIIADRFGVAVGAKFVPVYRATLRADAELNRARERAAVIVAGDLEALRAGIHRTRRTTVT